MKIAFICGSLAPGLDGVGDYTRRLAGELLKQGHEAVAIAFTDKHLKGSREEGTQDADGAALPVLRLAPVMPENERVELLQAYLAQFKPNWVSLQFVPFSFHKKGLPYKLAHQFSEMARLYQWHIMFHELWVGVHGGLTAKNKILAQLQRFIILRFIKKIKPGCVTTSTVAYQKQLVNSNAKILPLFSNIPLNTEAYEQVAGIDDAFIAVQFGGFSAAVNDFRAQITYLSNAAKHENRALKLVTLGVSAAHKEQSLQIARELLGSSAIVEKGYLSEDEVSAELLKARVGISKADAVLYSKSGSTMAMFEHGLPVLLRGKSDIIKAKGLNGMPYQERICFVDYAVAALPPKQKPQMALKKVTDTFIQFLQQS